MTHRNFGRSPRMYEPPSPRSSLWRSLLSAATEGLGLTILLVTACCLALLLGAVMGGAQ
jgi:hypothetical protein